MYWSKPQVEARIPALWSLANIATLIGLVGTVFGLITAFAAISGSNLSQAEKQALLTGGIAEAMYNTDWVESERLTVDRTGPFSIELQGLDAGTDYQYRAVIHHPEIVIRGDHKRFQAR